MLATKYIWIFSRAGKITLKRQPGVPCSHCFLPSLGKYGFGAVLEIAG